MEISQVLSDIGLVFGVTLMYATPLVFAALGGTISENAGVVNIGLEGIMSIGAFAAAAIAWYVGSFDHQFTLWAPWIALLLAGVAGILLSGLHALAVVCFKADHVISGIAINFLGPGFAFFTSKALFNGATQTPTIPHKIPKLFESIFPENSFFALVLEQEATVYLSVSVVFFVWLFLYRTPYGLRLRAVGEHPKAAMSLGIKPENYKIFAILTSGFLAGIGGASLSIAVVSAYSPSLISGQGFIALAAMIFGKWKPQGAFLACLFFGLSQGLTVYLGRPQFGVPSQFLAMVPYLATLLILVLFVGKAIAPRSLGVRDYH